MDDDRELQVLLQSNSIQDVGEEMDETEIVVKQLEQKKNNLKLEILQVQADLANSQSYSETMEYQSRYDELTARQDVVQKYLQKARKRLLQLQTKYKELIVVQGQNDPVAGGRTGRSYNREPSSSSSSTSTPSTTRQEGTNDDWKREGFGSFGGVGQRGSSRRHRRPSDSRQSGSTTTTSSSSTTSASRRYESPRSTTTSTTARTTTDDAKSSSSSTSYTKTTNQSSYVPPHRRPPSEQALKDDATRLREIKVEEEFDKLKKELGL
jgi:hypothetical protein